MDFSSISGVTIGSKRRMVLPSLESNVFRKMRLWSIIYNHHAGLFGLYPWGELRCVHLYRAGRPLRIDLCRRLSIAAGDGV